jgi:hypothetical protein
MSVVPCCSSVVLFCSVLSSPGLDVAGSRLPVGFASGAADLRMLFIFFWRRSEDDFMRGGFNFCFLLMGFWSAFLVGGWGFAVWVLALKEMLTA